MPTKKRWVIDEKGYHQISEFVPATSKKTSEYLNDEVTIDEPPEYAIQLQEGKWLPGDDGFQFNKTCFLQIKGRYLKETKCKKVIFDIYVEFEDEEEDLCQQVEAYLDDKCEAKAEAILFYGEKYSKAYNDNPNLKCHYKFKAHNNTCKNDIESELLEMPEGQEEFLGFASIKLVNPINIPIGNIPIILNYNDKKWPETFTSESGELTWDRLPLGQYIIEISTNDNVYTFDVPWHARVDAKPEIIIMKIERKLNA